MIEEGRFRGIERNLRICLLCPMNIIEDEYQYSFSMSYLQRTPKKNIYLNFIADGPSRTNLLKY